MKFTKAPAYRGKYLSLYVDGTDRRIIDGEVLTGTKWAKFVSMGYLVPVADPAPAPKPVKAKQPPTPKVDVDPPDPDDGGSEDAAASDDGSTTKSPAKKRKRRSRKSE